MGDLGSGNDKDDLGGCHFHSISFNNLQVLGKKKIYFIYLFEVISINLLLIDLNKNNVTDLIIQPK